MTPPLPATPPASPVHAAALDLWARAQAEGMSMSAFARLVGEPVGNVHWKLAGRRLMTLAALCSWADAWSASGREALGVWSDAGGVYIVPVADVHLPPEAE